MTRNEAESVPSMVTLWHANLPLSSGNARPRGRPGADRQHPPVAAGWPRQRRSRGSQPNSFLAEHSALLTGPVLSLSEGEGRNAVFLATLGFDVLGVDISSVGLEKARQLAQLRGVKIRTEVADLATYEPGEARFGAVISISAHLPEHIRRRLYPLIARSLKPGGIIVFEAYAESQLARDTGGPKDVDMLMTVEKIRSEFPTLEPIVLREVVRNVSEGEGRTGMASVVQFVARRTGSGTPGLRL